MSRFTKQITSYWQQFRTVVRNEYGSIFTDAGVILVLVLALLIYSTLYSLAYGTQVLRNVPIGVIDMSNTSTSRQLINTFNAGPNVYVAYEPGDMDEAKHLFYDREIYGVVYIPSDYEEKLLGGQQAVVSLYVDASYFLMYRQAFQELVSGIGTTGAMVEFQRLIAKGANIPQATATTQPVIYQSHNLFNPYLGYGSFVMPAIIDARMALPVRPDSAEQQRGRRVHPAPKYGGFVQRRVARGTYPVDSHDSLRRIRCCRHTPSPQEGRR